MTQLQDLKAGDTVVYMDYYSKDWITVKIDSVTPTMIRAMNLTFDRDTGRQKGDAGYHRITIQTADDPRFIAYRAECVAVAAAIAPALASVSLSQLKRIAETVRVKLGAP